MSAEKRRAHKFIIGLAFFAAAVVLPLYAFKVWQKTDYTDFEVYYRSAARAARGEWEQVYTLADGASPFRYAPVTLPFFRPFAYFPLRIAKELWYFLQFLSFASGIYFINQTLKRVVRPRGLATVASAFSALFILRFCLDCFTIGQVSSILFLCFSLSLYYWTSWRSGAASVSLLIPALVKIGPAFLYPLFLHGRPKARRRAIFAPILALAVVLAGSALWLGPWDRVTMLWSRWLLMVRDDSQYYDASHYGSQSIKSALLRLVNSHWLSPELALRFYLIASLIVCGSVLLFWLLRFPRRPMGRASSYALGVFPYLWVMPETFKYSLTALAIPVALIAGDLLQAPKRSKLSLFALLFGLATLSLAGKDVVGDTLFFGSQKLSIPLLATFFIGAATARLAWIHSRPAWLSRELKHLLRSRIVAPWSSEIKDASLSFSLLAPLPMQSGTSLDAQAVLNFIHSFQTRFEAVENSYEILIQPYGDRLSETNALWKSLQELASRDPRIQLLKLRNPSEHFPTRNAAIRESFILSRGHLIFTAQLEQPCDGDFYVEALKILRTEQALIRGNRRLQETRFRIPVRLLPIVFRRHRLGLWFNRLVRILLGIQTTDTHSGTYALPRRFAEQAFALQSSLGFLFDLELALVAKTHGWNEIDRPVTLILAEEKTTRRMGLEALSILQGLPSLARRYRRGFYSPMKLTQAITADDWGLTPEVNQGILDLAHAGIIKRVSIMAKASHLEAGLKELIAIPGIELGLHYDLTYRTSSPRQVFFQWMSPVSDRKHLKRTALDEFTNQMSRLKGLGIPISYMDGHHHIHLVPGIIPALSEALKTERIRAIRCPYDPSLWLSSKAVLNVLAIFAQRVIRREGFTSLPCFYPAKSHFSDPGRLRAALARNPHSEIIVHPARSNDLTALQIPDPYTDGRVLEYRALRMLRHLS